MRQIPEFPTFSFICTLECETESLYACEGDGVGKGKTFWGLLTGGSWPIKTK